MAAKASEAGASGASDYSPLVVFVGVGTCVASIIGLLLFADPLLSETEAFIEKVVMALTMAASFLLVYSLHDRLTSLRGEAVSCSIGTFGLVAFALAAFLPNQPFAAHVLLDAIAAVGISLLITIWFVDLCLRPRRQPLSHVAGAFGIGLIIVCAQTLFEPSVRDFAVAIAWAISSTLSFIQWRQHCAMEVPPSDFDPATDDGRSRIRRESYIMMASTCCGFGFLLGMARGVSGEDAPFVIAAAMVAVLLLAIDAATKRPRISERSLFPLTAPATTAAYLCVYLFGDGVVHTVALCVLAVFTVIYLTMGTVALSTHVVLERLEPVRFYAKARMLNYCAVGLGIALGFAASWAFETGFILGVQVTALIAIAYSFIAAFFHRARFPDSTLKADGTLTPAAPAEKDQWVERCFEVSERHGLSSRQFEVLCLIAQGRNAEYVAHALVISVSTVQTHIRNIYQKLGVHSRQELIDLIEGTKLYGED